MLSNGRNWIAITLALVFVVAALLAGPSQSHASAAGSTGVAAPGLTAPAAMVSLPAHEVAASTAPHPQQTFPRTVLIEPFTGVWCIHCPAESVALHWIDENTSHNVVAISELHVCAFPSGSGPCLDNFVPPDGTSDSRGVFYNVCGYPDVFFDGQHDACGATNYASQMYTQYENAIANASRFPGNVSISESAVISGGNVTDHANITSGINGTYNAITYLLEHINKMNQSSGYGPHDVDWVVRETMHNHPVTLTAGATTEISSMGAIMTGWNPLNFSVVTFVQQNSTKIIENTNWALVTSLVASLSSSQSPVTTGKNTTITVQASNSTTGSPIGGAQVSMSSNGGGSFSPATGVTASDGSFSTTFTAPPNLSAPENLVITASLSAANYTNETATLSLVVNPQVLSIAPTGLDVISGEQQVGLNWTVPAAGGAGVTYHIYRATARAGPFTPVSTSFGTAFNDTTVVPGQSYWYKVSASSAGGFSTNTSVATATAVTVTPTGLSWDAGYWFSVGSGNFSAPTNSSLPLYLPDGFFSYNFGPGTYGYLASGGSGTLTTSGTSLNISVAFTPRYATLEGTVSPSDATVTVAGSPIAVSGGSFQDLLAAGTYAVSISASGYLTDNRSVTLTPGNTSSMAIDLKPAPSNSASGSSGSLSPTDLIAIGAGAVAAIAAVGAALVLSARRKGRGGARGGRKAPDAPSPEEP